MQENKRVSEKSNSRMLPTCCILQRPNNNKRRKREGKWQTKGGKETVKEDQGSSLRRCSSRSTNALHTWMRSTNALHTCIQAETFPQQMQNASPVCFCLLYHA
eukprot:2713925-Rhodomonas_salina.1